MGKRTISQVLHLCGFTPNVLNEYHLDITRAQPVKKVIRLTTTRGELGLKKFDFLTEELHFSLAAMRHVKKHGYAVPDVIPTRDGRFFVERNGIKYFVMEWLGGRESNYSDLCDLGLATRGLAGFHAVSRGFDAPQCPGKEQWGTWKGHFGERINEMRQWSMLADKGNTAFDQMFAEGAKYWIQEASHAVEILSGSRYEEITELEQKQKGFCHHDYADHNVLLNNKEVALIDFDYAICDVRAHDLSSLLLRSMRKVNWDLPTALYIVRSYFEVATPHQGEERLLYAMLRFPQDFYELGRFFYLEKKRLLGNLEKRLRQWKKQKERRKRFLGEFEQGALHMIKNVQRI